MAWIVLVCNKIAVGSVGSGMTISGLNVSFPDGDERASCNRDLAICARSATLLSENETSKRHEINRRVSNDDRDNLIVKLTCGVE